jgi:hypothetical protein
MIFVSPKTTKTKTKVFPSFYLSYPMRHFGATSFGSSRTDTQARRRA